VQGGKSVLAIRLYRAGTKNRPFYRIVVSESTRTPGSRVTAQLGIYDPTRKPEVVNLDVAKAEEWMRRGAHASDTVRSLIERARGAQA
jgi:small subunit ribosomal protein S16